LKLRFGTKQAIGSGTLLALFLGCGSSGSNGGSSAGSGANAGSGASGAGASAGGQSAAAAGGGSATGAGASGRGSAGAATGNAGGASAGGTTANGGATAGGATGSAGATANGGAGSGCTPDNGFAYTFACWQMPNPASAGLPNPSSYSDQGDGTVRDNVTGLLWQKAVDMTTQKLTWDAAKSYCSALTLAGHTWRLPTRIELLSIVDFTRVGSAIDATAFPGTPGGAYHWTSSPWVVSQIATKPQDSWIVNFYEGLTSNAGDRTAAEFARCVSTTKQGPMPNQYTALAGGEVQDNETGLIWVQATSPATLAPADALTYCQTLGLNGHTFRLPSIKELSTLVDENPPITAVSPAINKTLFPDTKANGWYLSSSKWAGPADKSSSGVWAINYEDGFTDPGYSSHFTDGWARCVR
jgi:Protein of unknown function (DUF1566)